MASVSEEETWADGVYQLEVIDPVQGGVDGIDNVPHIALANRTVWLKAQLILKALVGGSAAQLFKVKAAVADDEAVNKAQMNTAISGIDLSTKVNKTEVLGIEQAWQDLTASRSQGNTYTNSTGKPIYISLITRSDSSADVFLEVDGIMVDRNYEGSAFSGYIASAMQAIVANGSTYKLTDTAARLDSWLELR